MMCRLYTEIDSVDVGLDDSDDEATSSAAFGDESLRFRVPWSQPIHEHGQVVDYEEVELQANCCSFLRRQAAGVYALKAHANCARIQDCGVRSERASSRRLASGR